MKFFQNKKWFLALVLILVGGLFLSFLLISQSKKTWQVEPDKLTLDSNQKDRDYDGLPDWQEALFGTNPNQPDTDNDGYLDGEEIASGHNPRKRGPGDQLEGKPGNILAEINPSPQTTNLTNLVSQNIVQEVLTNSTYLQNPDSFDPETDLASLLESSEGLRQVMAQGVDYFVWPGIDNDQLNISPLTTPEAVSKYLKSTMSIFASSPPLAESTDLTKKAEKELEIVQAALNGQNPAGLVEIIEADQRIYNQLKGLKVPISWLAVHKRMLEMTWLHQQAFQTFKDPFADPLKTALALEAYDNLLDSMKELNQQINNSIKQKGISLD